MNEEGDILGGSDIDKSQQELTVNRMNTRSKIIELATGAQAIRIYFLSFIISSIVCLFSINEIVEMFLISAKSLFVLFINSFAILLIFNLIKKEDVGDKQLEEEADKSQRQLDEHIENLEAGVSHLTKELKESRDEIDLYKVNLNSQSNEMKSKIDAKSEEVENLNTKSESSKKKNLAMSYGKVDFKNLDDPSHDVTFVMKGGRKVYANMQLLSGHSLVFREMFSCDFTAKNQKEIQLNDIHSWEFCYLLEQIYYPSTKIAYRVHANSIALLGRRFNIAWIVDKCGKYFITDLSKDQSSWKIASYLRAASEYDLVELQNHCIDQLKTITDVEKVKNEVDSSCRKKWYDGFSDDIKAALEETMKDLQKKMKTKH